MASHKLTTYNKDNILGWSESDFRDVQCQLINVKILAGNPLTPKEMRFYLNESDTWHKERIGVMNKFFKSFKDRYEKKKNYKVDAYTKKLTKEQLIHLYITVQDSCVNWQEMVENIFFALRDGVTTLDEIKEYIETNKGYMTIYPKVDLDLPSC